MLIKFKWIQVEKTIYLSYALGMEQDKWIDLHIHDVAFGGMGVGRDQGLAIFVPGVVLGERVRVRIATRKKRHAIAVLEQVLERSPQRVAPPCPVYGQCGGCQYQHMTYEAQIHAMNGQLIELVRRIGGLSETCCEPMQPAPESYGYRNKIVLHGPGLAGFYRNDNTSRLPIEQCKLALAPINSMMKQLYKKEVGRDLVLRCNRAGQCIHYETGTHDRRLKRKHLIETMLDMTLKVPWTCFFQANTAVTEQLLAWIRAWWGEHAYTTLIDAYCGVGLFSLALADLVDKGCGTEIDSVAIGAARTNAAHHGHEHLRFLAGRTELLLAQELAAVDADATCVVLDPPRQGCSPTVLATLGKYRPAGLLYIACNPPVLTRDLKRLHDAGYTVERLKPFDMFPQTAHFEVVAALTAKD